MRSRHSYGHLRHQQPNTNDRQPSITIVRDENAASSTYVDSAQIGRERDELHQQLFEAAQIQRKLSGPRTLRLGELECAREVFAARYLSGDFTVFYEHRGKLFAAVGDITGKGTPAGMWFTHLVGLIQRYSFAGADPAQIAAEVNVHLCSLRPLGPFVTMFLAQIDPETGQIDYCNAGHFPPVILRNGVFAPCSALPHHGVPHPSPLGEGANDDTRTVMEEGGPLLGALPEAAYNLGHERLRAGDTLVAYSDGVIECCNQHGEEFGLERLVSEASRLKFESAQMALLTLLGAVQDFSEGSPACDDMSLMVIRRNGAAAELAASLAA